MFKFIFGACCSFYVILFSAFPAHAGIVVGGTRFIFNGDQDSISFQVKNTSTNLYLVQTKIFSGIDSEGNNNAHDKAHEVPFVATPMLFRLKPLHDNYVRILKVPGQLPQDRETLFWLTIAGIPASQDAKENNTVQIAVRNKMKLFYRPKNLPGNPKDSYKSLAWSRQGKTITVKNQTPYFVTLLTLTVNGQNISRPGMVAPYSLLSQPWCPEAGRCDIQWQAINDYGAATPIMHPQL